MENEGKEKDKRDDDEDEELQRCWNAKSITSHHPFKSQTFPLEKKEEKNKEDKDDYEGITKRLQR